MSDVQERSLPTQAVSIARAHAPGLGTQLRTLIETAPANVLGGVLLALVLVGALLVVLAFTV